ncbi:enoyl-CoA hydratase-related protein [Desertimonas flava]|uniref:enoyl-CoA hydratase-related protein n=1 Tax=Desertimonas flava TaxID=2064846 RepID=UPI0013C53438|nr:enoyl-CoA hydratase-related protein [Desertimonas flava]
MTGPGVLYEGFEHLGIERPAPGILVATLNRPDKLNALRRADHDELTQLLRTVPEDDDTRVLVLRGAGRSFCVGGDLGLVEETVRGDHRARLRTQRMARDLVQAQIDLEKPVVVAVQGQCSGAGAALALLCDIIVAERSATFADGHVRHGMAAGDGGVLTLPLAMGIVRAKRYLLSGDWFGAEEAERCGLVTEVVDDGASFERAMEWAERLSALNPAAVQLTKRAVNGWLAHGMTTAFNLGLAFETLSFGDPDTEAALSPYLPSTAS